MQKIYFPLVFFFSFFISSNINSQSFEQTQKIYGSDGSEGQQFGFSVAISENYLVAGAKGNGENIGACYIFLKNLGSWVQMSKLTSSDKKDTAFGCAVNISGEQIIVGERLKEGTNGEDSVGDAYVYKAENGSWTRQSLLPDDSKGRDGFGSAISINGDYMIISSPNYSNTGSIYLYKKNNENWNRVQKVTNDLDEGRFGYSLDMTNKYALIGAPVGGSAYLYSIENDILKNPVKLSYGIIQDQFGYAVGLTNEYLFVSSVLSDVNGPNSGSVYVFNKVNGFWVQHQLLTPKDGSEQEYFGVSIEVSGDYLYIGSDFDENNDTEKSGCVYVFQNNNGTWEEIKKITASDPTYLSRFGFSIASNNSELVIGAMYHATGITSNTGAAYIFSGSTLGVTNEILSGGLSLYPNPVSNTLSIDSKIPLEKAEIYSVLGEKIKEVNAEFNSIALENLSKGIYLVRIYSEKGSEVRKMIKN